MAHERRCVPAMGEEVPVGRQSMKAARGLAPRHCVDAPDARA